MLTKPDITKPVFLFYPNAVKDIVENKCPMCHSDIKESDFKDELSKKEYSISGMCQKCQDEVFTEES